MKMLLILLQFTFMTYNVENLFDTRHDTLKNDIEYTPEGKKKWTERRMMQKIHNIMQVISAQEELPVVVGLCEVENDSVLRRMTSGRYAKLGYGYVHYEGGDPRGIDVAVLYRKDVMTVDTSYPVTMEGVPRQVLYVRGRMRGGITLHVIQVHAPSRRGGAVATTHLRCRVASGVRSMADSILGKDSTSNILIMGDFNDTPTDVALADTLQARMPSGEAVCLGLYNLSWPLHDDGSGTYYYRGEWNMLDHIIVSGAMLKGSSGIEVAPAAVIYSPEWLRDKDEHPRRTYLGDFYQGGASDHFPLLVNSVKQ